MEKFIPYDKLSKKERRKLDAMRRGTWSISPVTRRVESKKRYDRKKAGRRDDYPDALPFDFFLLIFPQLSFCISACPA